MSRPPAPEAEDLQALRGLVAGQRWAALASVSEAAPLASMVAYAQADDDGAPILHLSRLARHTRNVLTDPRVSLVISETDAGNGDPQTLARVGIDGQLCPVERGQADYEVLKRAYLDRLPSAGPLFGFTDFSLFRLSPVQVHYVAGFARSWRLDASVLRPA